MTPQLNRVESIFAAAVARPAEERLAYLDQACGGDVALRQRVEALLKAHEEAAQQSFLTNPYQPASAIDPPSEGPGTRIGPYKLLQQIGEGGMGVVFMAEQEQPVKRRVALKIIKPGMDSAQVIARFEAERQALAMMDHPNIARVFDADTTESGRPYFVMELVYGVPITKFCDDQQLDPRQRLELFVPVCQAIQHAHQKGIIHRDVKPSNVLVTMHDDRPVPKVIDFGVAKAVEQRLTEKTLFTQFGAMVGTLEYMSPEQAEMNAFGVDTRSDVYSLGVLLYELLTGTTPLERKRLREAAYTEVLHLIKELEPPRPSARLSSSGDLPKIAAARKTDAARLPDLLRGEIDWIVMRCLEKDRSRRYETASALARDVEHYLKDEPVEACPPSVGYRLRKFARKNRVVLTTAAAFVALLLVAVGVSTWLAVLANEHRQEAEEAGRQAGEERDRADRAAKEATANAVTTRRALDRMTVAKGIQLAEEGNLFAALPWLVQPLEHGGLSPEEEKVHRTRMACYLRHTPGRPRLRQTFFCEKRLVDAQGYPPQIAFSADAQRVLAIAEGVVRVWDLRRGDLLATFQPSGGVWTAQFSPDGTRILTASGEATGGVWDASNGRPVGPPLVDWGGLLQRPLSLLPTSPWQFLASAGAARAEPLRMGSDSIAGATEISRDGRRALFTFTTHGLRLLDLQTQKLVGQWRNTGWYELSPDGRTLLQADGNLVHVHDTSVEKAASRSIDQGSPVASLAFSPDGSRAVSVGKDQVAQIWDARTWQRLARIPVKGSHGLNRNRWRLSPDNRLLAGWTNAFGDLAWWEVETGKLVHEFTSKGMMKGSTKFDWRPDGRQLLWVFPERPNEVRLLDAAFDRETGLVVPHTGVVEAAYAPDGRTLATAGSDGVIRIWDLCDADEAAAAQPLGKHLFPADIRMRQNMSPMGWTRDLPRTIEVKTVAGSQTLAWLDPQSFLPPGTDFEVGTLSPDQSRVITLHMGSRREMNLLKLWDAHARRMVGSPLDLSADRPPEWRWGFACHCAAFSPDSRRFAVAASDWFGANTVEAVKVQLYDARTGEPVGKSLKHDGPVDFAAFSPDSELLVTCSQDATARLWRTKTGEPAGERLRHGDEVTCAAFAPNGKTLATGSLDGTVRLWEVSSGRPAGVLMLNLGHAWDLAFPPNEPLLLVSYWDRREHAWANKIQVFDAASLQEVSPPVEGFREMDRLQFRLRPDGRVAFGLWDQRTWDLTPDPRPAGDLVKLAQLHTQHRFDPGGGMLPLTGQELHALWQELRGKYPA